MILKSLGHNNKVQLKMSLLSWKGLSDGRRNVFNITPTRRVALTGSFYLKVTCQRRRRGAAERRTERQTQQKHQHLKNQRWGKTAISPNLHTLWSAGLLKTTQCHTTTLQRSISVLHRINSLKFGGKLAWILVDIVVDCLVSRAVPQCPSGKVPFVMSQGTLAFLLC